MSTTPSPLRYPGGKTKLYKKIQPIIKKNISGNNRTYIEPFAGGSGLALKLLFNNDVDHLILNDIDYHIYCFWHSCLYFNNELCDLIINCMINIDTWRIAKNIYLFPESYSVVEVGFATFFLNRCNVSGVIQGGPIGGYEQHGKYLLDARFNKHDLINKIKKIGDKSDNIIFYNMDALFFLQNNLPICGNNTFLNIDPPYVKKGKLLYENSFCETDHTELSKVVRSLNYKWIVTYDKCDLINQLYDECQKEYMTLDYSAGNTHKGSEILIYSDLIEM